MRDAPRADADPDCTPMNIERVTELQQQAWDLQAAGRLDEAAEACRAALCLAEADPDGEGADVANLLNDLAEIEADRQDFSAAEGLARRADAIEGRLGDAWVGDDAARIRIRTCTLLGEILRVRGECPPAHHELQRALDLALSAFGDDSGDAAQARNNLAVVCKQAGRFEEALTLYRKALVVILRGEGPETLAAAAVHHNIGGVLHAMGDFVAAQEPGRTAWGITRRLLGEDDPRTQLDAAAYAAILDGLGRYRESEAIHRRALAIMIQHQGPDHVEVAALMHNLAAVVGLDGRQAEAEQLYRRALQIKDQAFGAESSDAALTRINLAGILNGAGCFDEAESLLMEARSALTSRLEPDHPHWKVLDKHLSAARAGIRR
jgi:tetratricopeptide (TPR) repeat protein